MFFRSLDCRDVPEVVVRNSGSASPSGSYTVAVQEVFCAAADEGSKFVKSLDIIFTQSFCCDVVEQ